MAIFDRLLVVPPGKPVTAALNMAIDEAILESITSPVVRFFNWAGPSISFGYFGNFDDVSEFVATHDLVRRWTGGGIVFHERDLTYSLIVPSSSRALDSKQIYREVHEALRDSLNQFGLGAEVVAQSPATTSKACFVSPVLADVTIGKVKVAGAAHRRTKAGVLHQGSIQNLDLPPELGSVFVSHLSDHAEVIHLSDSIMERASAISANRYGTLDWLKRR